MYSISPVTILSTTEIITQTRNNQYSDQIMGWTTDEAQFDSWWGKIALLSKKCRPALRPT